MTDDPGPRPDASRRSFLVQASALLAAASTATAVTACDPPPVRDGVAAGRRSGSRLASPTLDALADAVLPEQLGPGGRQSAVTQFVTWADEFEPVAQEMLGYGYADIRYLPSDPVPGWIAQLDGLERLARTRGATFATLPVADRRALLDRVIPRSESDALPAPLTAPHVALALLAHWASSTEAWDLALGVQVQRDRCRSLATTADQPRPLPTA